MQPLISREEEVKHRIHKIFLSFVSQSLIDVREKKEEENIFLCHI